MPEELHREVVIVGGGASAVLTAWNLARWHRQQCTIIEPSHRPGFGLAYATPSLRNLLNVPAGGMSADPENADHFLDWLRAHVAPEASYATFVPRAIYGLYLHNLYDLASPEHVRGTAIECRREGGVFRLMLDDGRSLIARKVVLACGHFDPAPLPGLDPDAARIGRYHHNAWAAGLFGSIHADDDVTLIGTGLTTVDVILRLREHGHRGVITAISSKAAFPSRHAAFRPLPAPIFDTATTTPTALAYLLAFRAALRRGMEWRVAVDSLRPVVNALWAALPDPEKHRFRRHLQRRWDVHRHRMAPQIADILDGEVRARTLRMVEGRVTAVTPGAQGLLLTCCSGAGEFQVAAAHAINCTGPSLNYRRVASPVVRRLLAIGDAVPGFGGAGLLCAPDGNVIDARGTVVPGLFTIGPARLGVLFESIAIPEIRRQAFDLATHLAQDVPAGREAA